MVELYLEYIPKSKRTKDQGNIHWNTIKRGFQIDDTPVVQLAQKNFAQKNFALSGLR